MMFGQRHFKQDATHVFCSKLCINDDLHRAIFGEVWVWAGFDAYARQSKK
jgi:fido (protein-threonine AMPylation protein)